VVDGIATLLGYVDDELVARRAVQATLAVQGVRAVVDRMLIPRTGEGSRWLERTIRAALTASPTVESYELRLRVRDGTVRLEGVVQSYTERQAAEDIAWSVRGVYRVSNEIRVTLSSARRDREIAADVEYQLLADAHLDDNSIQVQVARGIVQLSGRVGSEFEKERAVVRAWVVGVRGVDGRALRIAPTPEDCLERQYEPRFSDPEISSTVADALRLDPRVGTRNIQVVSQGGVVTLTGAVAIASARTAAEADAANTLGVNSVQNQLRVGVSCERGPCADAG
jgi:osmotically-inducible protein OsmY